MAADQVWVLAGMALAQASVGISQYRSSGQLSLSLTQAILPDSQSLNSWQAQRYVLHLLERLPQITLCTCLCVSVFFCSEAVLLWGLYAESGPLLWSLLMLLLAQVQASDFTVGQGVL